MKTKTFVTVIISLLVFVGNAYGQKRSAAQMKSIVSAVMKDANLTNIQEVCSSTDLFSAKESGTKEAQFYIYNHTDGKPGFTIVSANEDSHPVIAYSTNATFDINNMPEGMKELLLIYAKRAAAGDLTTENLKKANALRAYADNKIEPLLGGIAFNQGAPFNDMCPLYNGERCVTGCTATAMSMIMAYYRHPERMKYTTKNISYTTSSKKIKVNWDCSNTIFDWNNILDDYAGRAYSDMEDKSTISKELLGVTNFALSSKYNGYLAMTNLCNISGSNFNGEVQLVLTNDNGEILYPASEPVNISGLGSGYYYSEYPIMPSISSEVPDGSYRLQIAAKTTGATGWSIVKKASSLNNLFTASQRKACYLTVTKTGSSCEILGTTFGCGYGDKQAAAVAMLSGACGATIKADYDVDGTAGGVFEAIYSFVDYMDYAPTIEYLDVEFFTTDGWHEYIQSELTNLRPLFLTGYGDGSGHAFVLDGYEYKNEVPYYHINWGWGGHSNAYFLIDYLKPSVAGTGGYETNYADELHISGKIKPNEGEDPGVCMAASSVTLSKKEVKGSEYITVTANKISNRCVNTFTGTVYIDAVDAEGNVTTLGTLCTISDLRLGYYYQSFQKAVKFPSTVHSGNYTIKLRAVDSENNEAYAYHVYPSVYVTTSIPDGISNVVNEDNTDNGSIFNLNGMKVATPVNGNIYIKGGKKVVVK